MPPYPASMLSNGFFLSLSLCLDIGLVNVAILSSTLSHGFRPGFWLGLGSCFGDLVYAALALAGMAVLLQFDVVRWIVWLGGGVVLLFLTWKMARDALRPAPPAATDDESDTVPRTGALPSFLRGILLAMASPSSIVWFAAVGGALIAKAGATTPAAESVFLIGFFLGGFVWTLLLCSLASRGRQYAGAGLTRACRGASAMLFAYFSYHVIVGGYRELIVQASA